MKRSDVIHVLVGFITGLLMAKYYVFSVFIYLQFMIYELVEWHIRNDDITNDLKEFAIGFAVGFVIALLATIMSLHIVVSVEIG